MDRKTGYSLLLVLCFLVCSLVVDSADATENTSVFVLHSYSQEYPWTKRQHEGFMQRLRSTVPNPTTVCVEYLDAKRVPYTADYANLMAEYLGQKYKAFKPKIIYVTDDNALAFAVSHLTNIFPNTPVFFSGVNDYKVKSRLSPDRFTGVFERKEVAPSLELMRSLAPDMRDILVVGDKSETFQTIRNEIEVELQQYPDIHARFLSDDLIEPLVESLHGSSERYVLLTTLEVMKDASVRVLTIQEAISSIAQAGPFIILCMEDVYLCPGVMGGYVTSGLKQGDAAAEMAIRHLAGAAVADIVPVESSPNEYIFDAKELNSIGLHLPPEIARRATILNSLPTFY